MKEQGDAKYQAWLEEESSKIDAAIDLFYERLRANPELQQTLLDVLAEVGADEASMQQRKKELFGGDEFAEKLLADPDINAAIDEAAQNEL